MSNQKKKKILEGKKRLDIRKKQKGELILEPRKIFKSYMKNQKYSLLIIIKSYGEPQKLQESNRLQ